MKIPEAFKRKRTHIDPDAVQAQTTNEAMDFIFAGIKYFLIEHTLYTLLALAVFFGGIVYTGLDYYSKYEFHKSHIEKQVK